MTSSSTPSATAHLIQASQDCGAPLYLSLLDAVEHINVPRPWDTSELVVLAAKLTPRGLHRNRYGSPIEWTREGMAGFLDSVARAAPTEALAGALQDPACAIADWVRGSERHFSFLAVDFDTRVYKVYLVDPEKDFPFEDYDLVSLHPNLHQDSYIDCLEIDMDEASSVLHSVYFRLAAPDLMTVLDPGYRPNAAMAPRLLDGVGDRDAVVAALSALTHGLNPSHPPIIKLRYSPKNGLAESGPEALGRADYHVCVNTFDAGRLYYVNDQRAGIMRVAEVLGCPGPVGDWLAAIAPFDCFIHNIAVSSETVTFYCRSTTLEKRQTAAFVRAPVLAA